MSNYLPDTSVCSIVLGSKVYTYAQSETGAILELRGDLVKSGSQEPTYYYDTSRPMVRRYRHDTVADDAPKLFTPLAVASYPQGGRKGSVHNELEIFYVDDSNRIRAMFWRNGGDWIQDTGLADLDIRCAAYSKLAAITVTNDLYNFITLYYQEPGQDAAIKTASYSGRDNKWVRNKPDLRDPPLYGTALTAVPPRGGILVAPQGSVDARQPVLYLQLDNLRLAHAQGGEPAEMPGFEFDGKPMVFSPHTSLQAVDDGTVLYILYKSNGGALKMIHANDGHPLMLPDRIADDIRPTPNGAISACLSPDKQQIVLFYQTLNRVTMKIDLYGLTLSKTSTASGTTWTHNNKPEKLQD